jgi:hypothetical protein
MSGAVSRRKAAAQRFVGFCATGTVASAGADTASGAGAANSSSKPARRSRPGQRTRRGTDRASSRNGQPRVPCSRAGAPRSHGLPAQPGPGRILSARQRRTLLFSEQGLALNIARYSNVGGGRNPGTPPLSRAERRSSRHVENAQGSQGQRLAGTPHNPDMWDWSADEGQQWWLSAVKARVRRTGC